MKRIYAIIILTLALTPIASATVPVSILKSHTVALAYRVCSDISSSFGIAFFKATVKRDARWPKGFSDCPTIMHAWNVATTEHEMQVWERRHAQDRRRVHEAMRILNAIKYADRAVREIHCVEHGTECQRQRWTAFNAAAAKAAAKAARETSSQMKTTEPKP